MAAPRVGVLALQGDVREHLRLLEVCGAEARPVRLPDEIQGLQGLVIPGGESTTMSCLIERFHLLEPLREALGNGTASLTTCAGTVLMAKTIRDGLPGQLSLGILDIVVRRNAFGRQLRSGEIELEVPAIGPEPIRVALIRAPAIEEVGKEVEVLATYEGQPAAVRQGRHLSLIFHPEITGDPRLHQLFLAGL
ncbi:MAG TPA: pyridoxal 5'-phosphate synthase glutaminase subunit PdxT [Candidatus Saccharimonadales bacterium]|nr:pyridoxal 5'-phosphate synthase glutaminase subunit PdxT [Candidatus Saccharimonadales bacterium]